MSKKNIKVICNDDHDLVIEIKYVMYRKEDLEQQAIQAIKENKLIKIRDVIGFMSCGKTAFYYYELHHNELIKSHILKNKKKQSSYIREKQYLESINNLKYTKGQGYVYLIHCKGTRFYKIGISKAEPKKRISSLQSGCPFQLEMVYLKMCNHYGILEKELHERYSEYRVMGEWFNLSDSLLLCVKNDIEAQGAKQLKLF